MRTTIWILLVVALLVLGASIALGLSLSFRGEIAFSSESNRMEYESVAGFLKGCSIFVALASALVAGLAIWRLRQLRAERDPA